MRNHTILLSLLASLTASGCQQLECADGTAERDGKCVAADNNYDPARCGPFTELVGDSCVPTFPPTVCQDGSTAPETDPETGVTTCVGTGIPAGCGSPISCPAPTGPTKQTICGLIYDFENNQPFAGAATGAACDPNAPTASGPCSLGITAYDAAAFADDPQDTPALPVTEVYIDDCGRYRVSNVDVSTVSLYVGLGFDDKAAMGPTGNTVTTAVATGKAGGAAVKEFEAWIVKPSTVTAWSTAAGTNLLTTGVYAPVFRQHKLGNGDAYANQSGVTMTQNGSNTGVNDFYFMSGETTRSTLVTNANATGANGTALITNASVGQSVTWSGMGGLGTNCKWETKAAASIPTIVFISVFRKSDDFGTCND